MAQLLSRGGLRPGSEWERRVRNDAYPVPQYISPGHRAKILSSVKDEGMAIVDAAKTYSVSVKTIRK